MVSDVEQVFVTAAVGTDVPASLGGTRYLVEDGRVERQADDADASGMGEVSVSVSGARDSGVVVAANSDATDEPRATAPGVCDE